MNILDDVYCPKCKSKRIENTVVNPLPEPESVSIDEFIEDSGKPKVSNLMMRYTNMKITCLDCGYSKKYSI